MDLSRYLETMKNLPDRFSNLAFWRGVRNLKDEMVKTFEYVDNWGKNVESSMSSILQNVNAVKNNIDSIENDINGMNTAINNIKPKTVKRVINVRDPYSNDSSDIFQFNLDYSVGNTRIFSFKRVGVTFPEFPNNLLPYVTVYLPYSYIKDNGKPFTGTLAILGRFIIDQFGNVTTIVPIGNAILSLSDTELPKMKNDFTSVPVTPNSDCSIEYTYF